MDILRINAKWFHRYNYRIDLIQKILLENSKFCLSKYVIIVNKFQREGQNYRRRNFYCFDLVLTI